MAADPLSTAIQSVKKKLAKSPVASVAAKLEKSLQGKDEKYEQNLEALNKAIAAEKKAAKDKTAVKELETLEKAAKADKTARLKPVDQSEMPS